MRVYHTRMTSSQTSATARGGPRTLIDISRKLANFADHAATELKLSADMPTQTPHDVQMQILHSRSQILTAEHRTKPPSACELASDNGTVWTQTCRSCRKAIKLPGKEADSDTQRLARTPQCLIVPPRLSKAPLDYAASVTTPLTHHQKHVNNRTQPSALAQTALRPCTTQADNQTAARCVFVPEGTTLRSLTVLLPFAS